MQATGAYRQMRNSALVLSAGSGSFRVLGLIARFGLTLYIARFLGFRAVSSYGFVTAGSAGMMALSGLGLDYRVSRSIIARPALAAIAQVRDRMALRSLAMILLLFLGCMVIILLRLDWITISVPALLILFMEPIVYDMQQALISRERPLAANFILFLRSAVWIPVIIAVGLYYPDLRTINVVFWGWAIGLLSAAIFAASCCAGLSLLRNLLSTPVNWQWIRESATSAPIVYLSEIGFFGQTYNDRFVIALVLNREAAGLYIFLWSMTNSVVPIVQAAIFNRITPILVKQWRRNALGEWNRTLRAASVSIMMIGGLWCGILVIVNGIIPLSGRSIGIDGLVLVMIMSLATILRLRADLLHQALFSASRDSDWIAVNLLGLILAPLLAFSGVLAFGLIGGGLQMMALAFALLIMRRKLVRLTVRDKTSLTNLSISSA